MTEYPAPAKINLHLAVTGVQVDGRHTLDTSFAYVDVGDTIHAAPDTQLRVTCSAPHLNGEKNLVYRVLAAMQQHFHVDEGLYIHVEKHLPEQAGLGGGSSDAATAMMVANKLWKLNLGLQTMIDFAVTYGADIPCFLFGHASMATGVGEKMTALPTLPSTHLVLIHPGQGLSTAAVFSAYDASQSNSELTPCKVDDTMPARSDGIDVFPKGMGENNLEAVARDLCPAMAALLDMMRAHSLMSWMSGSGTACVALTGNEKEAQCLGRKVCEAKLAAWLHTGRILNHHPLNEMLK